MNKNIYVKILIVISVLAGIISALAYPQLITPQEKKNDLDLISMANNEDQKCESCHKYPQNITSHINGGNFCLYCHSSKVHDYHVGTDTLDIDCIICHGSPPIIPQPVKTDDPGKIIVCNDCHAPPPDQLKTSNGNLIVIHKSRGNTCIYCHGNEIGEDHKEIMMDHSV
ncbi:MAG: hypothetical protein OIN87_07675 [Candidatus Methanoperedens sp.]|nr:hypothetical protein [Candidatus Methanoperedens sp.]